MGPLLATMSESLSPPPSPTPCSCGSEEADTRRGFRLEVFTLSWNIVEAVLAISAGLLAGSTALLGFGADSVVESLSSIVLLWRLRSHALGTRREGLALRLVGVSFLVLAAWVAYDALSSIVGREVPEASPLGIGVAVLSLIIMPILARAKRRVAARIESAALAADSRQTDLCAWLSAILLGGLLSNAVLGWWWADSAAALVMVPIIIRDGLRALRGELCADCHGSAGTHAATPVCRSPS
jgi:divalent metal cation (Fe/Co/Zn/Cd) transporter